MAFEPHLRRAHHTKKRLASGMSFKADHPLVRRAAFRRTFFGTARRSGKVGDADGRPGAAARPRNGRGGARRPRRASPKACGRARDARERPRPRPRHRAAAAQDRRRSESDRIRAKYPDRVPVICERADRSDVPDIDKKKYLVPADLTVGQFIYVIRKRIKLPPEKAIFIFVDNVIPPTASLMSAVYEVQKDEDGFLYVTYSGENTFG